MRTIWKLFTGDVRRITGNAISVLIVVGLVAIPGLFSWFNIAASWDPFGNTRNLKFAVASVDAGYRSDLVPIKITVGDRIVDKLRANSTLDWTFTSKERAIDGTKSGAYYAAVIIPKDFSKNMMTFFSHDARHPRLTYYTNEKMNALAPKVTGQGADEVAGQVNTMFAQTLTSTALEIASSLSDRLDTPQAKRMLTAFGTNMDDLARQLSDTAANLGTYRSMIAAAQSLLDGSNQLLDTASGSTGDAGKQLQRSVTGVNDVAGALSASTDTLRQALGENQKGYAAISGTVDTAFANASTSAGDISAGLRRQSGVVNDQMARYRQIADDLTQLAQRLPEDSPARSVLTAAAGRVTDIVNQRLTPLRDTLTSSAAGIDGGTATLADQRRQIKDLAQQASNSVGGLTNDFDTTIKPQLQSINAGITSATSSLTTMSGKLDGTVAQLKDSGATMSGDLSHIDTLLGSVADQLGAASARISAFRTKLDNALHSGKIADLRKLLAGDPEALATSLAAPVGLRTTAVFPVQNFGAEMTPFYTFIPLWVGSLLMCIALKTSVSRSRRRDLGDPKPYQMFLGRFGVFALISLLQSTFTCAGTLLFLRVHMVHPWLFMLSGWLSALVFILFIYTMVASFGNVGKALGVVILVMQISGSGGAYPLQLVPGFINTISPFLPVTHAVLAARSAIAGIYANDYWTQLGLVLLFVPPLLLVGLVLRKPLLRFNQGFSARVERTHLI
ncbi:YhgE/Pip domain-containing protein [Bifidobacterium mongoliense]|uniref:YhgE/Pip domain-containing protein n=1 Tax=Bifidobacterium mongoliense TaxID=518643 RepID=UPI002647E5C9|nr:YhgE/Pip domain-containing protein [Bifidobacterium mongoliense]MDN5979588.1 YhgE/Pip domain-containing protein [Bifidobacterium mongoliense]